MDQFPTPSLQPRPSAARARPVFWLALAFLVASAWGWLGRPPPAITAADVAQTRLDTAAPIPDGDAVLVQTITPRRDGLNAVTVTAARYTTLEQPADGTITIALRDGTGALRAAHTWSAAAIEHNQTLRLAFPPIAGSADQTFSLTITGSANRALTLWGSALDTHGGGQLITAAATGDSPADLAFTTEYTLTPAVATTLLAGLMRDAASLWWVALLALPLPGLLWLAVAPAPHLDRFTGAGLVLALGCAGWPLLWQWTTLLGWRWRAPSLWTIVVIGWVTVLVLSSRSRRQRATVHHEPTPDAIIRAANGHGIPRRSHFATSALGLTILVLAGYALRLLAIRDLAFLPWVDASRHALITILTIDQGQLLHTYRPLLDAPAGRYHYGFHTLAATLSLLSGQSLRPLLLHLHQLLSALVPLTIFVGTRLLFGRPDRSRTARGYVAAFLVALPFFMPSYYTSWGRLTQLTGALILPVLLGVTWRAAVPAGTPRQVRAARFAAAATALLTAGLFLIHFRVLLLYLLFVPIAWLWHRPWAHPAVQLRFAWTYGAAQILVLPELIRLARAAAVTDLWRTPDGYNAFPVGYFTTGWERAFVIAAGAAALAALATALVRRWRPMLALTPTSPALALIAWVGLGAALLSNAVPSLPRSWVISLNSATIMLFVPIALLLDWLVHACWVPLRRASAPLIVTVMVIAGVALAWTVRFSVPYQIGIVSEQTVLAAEADVPAIAWAEANLPADARVAHSAWQWLGTAWAGRDGAAWLLPLAAFQTTTPPVDYVYAPQRAPQVTAFNQAAQAVTDWSEPEAADLLRRYGVTHVYVGRTPDGFFKPAALARNTSLEIVYAADGVFIFALR